MATIRKRLGLSLGIVTVALLAFPSGGPNDVGRTAQDASQSLGNKPDNPDLRSIFNPNPLRIQSDFSKTTPEAWLGLDKDGSARNLSAAPPAGSFTLASAVEHCQAFDNGGAKAFADYKAGMIEQNAKDPLARDILVGTVSWTAACRMQAGESVLKLSGSITLPKNASLQVDLDYATRGSDLFLRRIEISQRNAPLKEKLLALAPQYRKSGGGPGQAMKTAPPSSPAPGAFVYEVRSDSIWDLVDVAGFLNSDWLDFRMEMNGREYMLTVELVKAASFFKKPATE